MRVFLAHVPAGQHVAQRLRATHERFVARQSTGITAGWKNLLGVECLQLDTFVAARQHALVEVGALEFHLHLLVPHRVVDLGKVGAEVEFFGNRDHDGSPDWYSEF